MSRKLPYLLPGLLYNSLVSSFMNMATSVMIDTGDVDVRRFGRVVQVLWKYLTILSVWHHHKMVGVLGQPQRPIVLPQNAQIHEFGVIRQLLFFLDDDAFAVSCVFHHIYCLNLWMLTNCVFLSLTASCHQRIRVYPLCSPSRLDWMGCISNFWRQLSVCKLACYSRIHDAAISLLCLLHSPSNPISSHSPVGFSGSSLHSTETAISFVGFLCKNLQNPSKSNLISSHSPVGFFGISLRCSDLATSLVDSH